MSASSPQSGPHACTNSPVGDARPIVFLSAVTFDSCLSGRTRRLAEALASCGRTIFFVEMPLMRAFRPAALLRPMTVNAQGIRILRLPPLPWRVRARWMRTTHAWMRLACSVINKALCGAIDAVLVTSTPWWLPVMRMLPASVRCYDYLDHIDVQAGPDRAAWFTQWDAELLDVCDVLTTVSEPLRGHLRSRCPGKPAYLVSNGVCGEWIDAAPQPASVVTRRPDAPLAGFLGALFEWVDLELLAATARLLPEVEFAVVGPTRRGVSIDRLHGIANVHCHGPVPFEQVPATLAGFDVCLIPFKQDLISEYADPLKVYEYCALGKPVVSTVLFNAGGPEPPIRVAGHPEAFARAIRDSLQEGAAERTRRIDFARQHTWEVRARQFVAAIEGQSCEAAS